MARFGVVIAAAGRSTRFGDPRQKKIFAELEGRAVWLRAVEPFVNRDDVAQIVVVIAPEDRELFERRFRANVAFLNLTVVDGGAERADSVAAGLAALRPECDHVAIHDAARPCVTSALIDAVFDAARRYGAAVPGLPVGDTLKALDADGRLARTVPRAGLVAVQTPQAFRRDWIETAYAQRGAVEHPTDDAQLVEAIGHPCHLVEGSPFNIKITRGDDLRLAAAILRVSPEPKRDRPAPPFAEERAMWGERPAGG